MSLFTDTKPVLKLKKTVSNPADPAEVVGYKGRNTFLGLDALVMKDSASDEEIEEGDVEYGFLIPEEEGLKVDSGDQYLYVLAEETVYGYTSKHYFGRQQETTIGGEVFHVVYSDDAAATWERRLVEVGN